MIPFFNALLKGRKAEGPNNEHRPIAITANGAAKVELSTATSPVLPGAAPPADTTGTLLWSNTNAGQEGVYFYDLVRAKWLDQAYLPGFSFGRDSADNQTLRTPGILTVGAGGGIGLPNQNLTLVGIRAHARSGNGAKSFQVRLNGAPIQTFALTAFEYDVQTLDVDIAAAAGQYLDVFAEAAGAPARDVSVTLFLRRRGP
jgi:hypothetical protein